MYLAFGIIFLLACIAVLGVMIFAIVRLRRSGGEILNKKNLLYIAPTFLIIYLLYIVSYVYDGKEFSFFSVYALVSTVLDAMKFKAASNVFDICKAYPIYYADFVFAYILGVAAVILGIASFFGRRISNFIAGKILLRKNCDIVVGNSETAVKYCTRTKNSLILCTSISTQGYIDLLKEKVTVIKLSSDFKQLSKKLKRGGYNVIVFRDGNHSYTKIMETFTRMKPKDAINVYLEANQQEMKILKDKFLTKADNNSKVYATGFNKYELMARKFVAEYPITKFIPRSFYNENFTLKNDRQINVVFVGFGKVNYQLFRMCSMQFQFAEEAEGGLASKPVRYYICDDKERALHNEFFSRIQFEIDEEFKDCDFPKPEEICKLEIENIDINSVDAKKKFKSLVTENSFTYFIVSLDNDLEDASYAQTVKRMLDADGNYRIFVRAKNDNGENLNELDNRVIYFGEEKKLYTHENIINDDLTELAQRINLLYNRIANPPEWLKKLQSEKDITGEEQRKILNSNLADKKVKDYMKRIWSELPYIEQASNLYHAVNLPFKLNLLGFDMVKKKSENDFGVTEEEFNKYYVNSGREEKYADYSFFFKTESSNVLAYIEHSRWNALYILYDYKQMKKADIKLAESKDEKGNVVKTVPHKNTALKQHACLTTYYGLDKLIKYKYELLCSQALKQSEYKNNECLQNLSKIYAYDYMDLDRLYSEITAMGYILKHNNS